MEYVYSAMVLHSAGKQVDEAGISSILTAAGIEPDETRIKALTACLEGIDIDEAIKEGIAMPTAAAGPAPTAEAPAEEKEEEEEEDDRNEDKEKEEAAAGLGSLF